METNFIFFPARRYGLAFHSLAILVLSGAGCWGLWRATQAQVGPVFLLYLLLGLLALAATPLLAYRAYALLRAAYGLERDAIHLQWGLRAEDIPMHTVLWVRPAAESSSSIPLPLVRWPGAILGSRRMPDGARLEFLAGNAHHLVLIATNERIYAISPEKPKEFLRAFDNLAEMGSLVRLPARSIYPAFLLARVWSDRIARGLLLGGAVLAAVLLGIVSIAIPGSPTISLGFDPQGAPREAGPSMQLLLLPVLNFFFYGLDLFLGLFFYRSGNGQLLAYFLWGSGVLSGILFLMAAIFILY